MRHLSRHVQATIQEHVRLHLVNLGWIGIPEGVPFGALPVTYQVRRPDEHLLKSITPNLVAVSFGSQSDDVDLQLGGGLVQQEHVVFVDVYAENEGVGLALAEDVRDLLVGRGPHSRFLPILNWMTQPPTPVPGYRVEFGGILREPAQRELANVEWQIVSGTATLLLPGVE